MDRNKEDFFWKVHLRNDFSRFGRAANFLLNSHKHLQEVRITNSYAILVSLNWLQKNLKGLFELVCSLNSQYGERKIE